MGILEAVGYGVVLVVYLLSLLWIVIVALK